ncbi:MAG TPA: hypothetical protein VF043_35350 [Ktedonobacteraceae bacterium]
MSTTTAQPAIGLGDQGLPMALESDRHNAAQWAAMACCAGGTRSMKSV